MSEPRFGVIRASDIANDPSLRMDAEYWLDQLENAPAKRGERTMTDRISKNVLPDDLFDDDDDYDLGEVLDAAEEEQRELEQRLERRLAKKKPPTKKVAASKKAASKEIAMTGVQKSNTLTRGQRAGAEVTLGLRARCAGFWITTRDEARTETDLVPAIAKAGYKPIFWDLATGALSLDGSALRGDPDYGPPEDPDSILDMIRTKSRNKLRSDSTDRNVWILRDLAPWMEGVGGALTLRKMRNLLRPDALSGTPRNVAQAIIILSTTATAPPELSNGELTVMDWPLPDREEIGTMLDGAVEVLPDSETNPLRTRVYESLRNGARDSALDAAVGLSSQEVQATFARSLIASNNINVTAIAAEKKRIISQEPAMEFFEPRPGGFDAVGGLENWKEWGRKQKVAYSSEAREYGLPLPKGVMLLGVSGCGKTLSCQALGSEWGWPVVRLDINALKGKYVGESEARLRGIFGKIDALGQVIVYIDEVEKALQGATSGSADGGVSSDALGAILTWMQDRAGQAFVMMTANDPSALPPEFLRKGRFDEIWWIDLPTAAERAAIVVATLRKLGRDAATLDVDLSAVVEHTESFTGAEIAALIERDAMFAAFVDGGREPTTDDIVAAAANVIPLAKTSAEKLASLRKRWADRARPATRPDTSLYEAEDRLDARVLDLDSVQ